MIKQYDGKSGVYEMDIQELIDRYQNESTDPSISPYVCHCVRKMIAKELGLGMTFNISLPGQVVESAMLAGYPHDLSFSMQGVWTMVSDSVKTEIKLLGEGKGWRDLKVKPMCSFRLTLLNRMLERGLTRLDVPFTVI